MQTSQTTLLFQACRSITPSNFSTHHLSLDVPMNNSSGERDRCLAQSISITSAVALLWPRPRVLIPFKYAAIRLARFKEARSFSIPFSVLTLFGFVRVVKEHSEFLLCVNCNAHLSTNNLEVQLNTEQTVLNHILSIHLSSCSSRTASISGPESLIGTYFHYSAF